MAEHAQTGEGGDSLWSSIADLTARLNNGQLIVFSHLTMLREELLSYHYDEKDGVTKIVEKDDDLIAALRYAVMKHKKGVAPSGLSPSERAFRRMRQPKIAAGVDIDPFSSLYSERP
jgi:hypothetical protein